LNILEQKSPDRTKLERQKNNLKIHFKTVLEGINSLIIWFYTKKRCFYYWFIVFFFYIVYP